MDKSIILRGDADIVSDDCGVPLDASAILDSERGGASRACPMLWLVMLVSSGAAFAKVVLSK